MNAGECDEIRGELVAFTDGELAATAAERVRRHVSECAMCGTLAESLRRSLAAAELLWTDAVVDAGAIDRRAPRHVCLWSAIVSAAAVLALAAGLWNLNYVGGREFGAGPPGGAPNQGAQTRLPEQRAHLVSIERSIARAGMAAELLAATDCLARAPGGHEYACEQYRYIARTYAGTAAAADSKLRLASLCEDHQ